MLNPQFAKVQYSLIPLAGGLDLVTPTLSLKPGVAREALNFESSITGGYSRIAGYERFDGRVSPSDATYSAITVNITAAISAGDTITGATSSATGVVIAVSGSVVYFTKATGTFTVSETVRVGGVAKGTVTALGGGSTSTRQIAQYEALAANVYRGDITAVPGSGPVRGVAYFNGTVYAWRDNAGGTALGIYKSTTSGWSAVALGQQLSFTGGVLAIAEGNIITGLVSGATATVTRVAVQTGTWAAGTAAGRLVFASSTGTFQAGEELRVSGVKYAVSAGAQSNITLLPGGKIETVIGSFGGANKTRLYGVDGVNKAFEFDGTVYVPIATGMATDNPSHVAVHKQHLFLSFGASLQFSGIGDQYRWSPVVGAGEISMTAAITLLLIQPGDQSTGAMAVYSNSDTSILYGTSAEDFKLASYNIGTGAKAYSGQNINQSYTFDDRGIITLATSLNYGNFDNAALTLNIRPFVQQRRNLVTASGVNREKGQYRVFFSDGYGLYMTFVNGQMVGCMPVQFPDAVAVMCEGEQPSGAETSFFGSTDGFVYRLDAGTSFDGDDITAVMTLVFNAIGSPRVLKRFRRASLEITGNGYSAFDFAYDLGYASPEYEQPQYTSYESSLQPSFWDAAVWDTFVWDGRSLAPSEVEVEGTAENIAVKISSVSNYYDSFTINSVILHYSMRRGLR